MSWDKAYDMAVEMDELREKIGQLEEELVRLQMENIRLKDENNCMKGLSPRRYITSTFCGTPEQYEMWREQYGWNKK